MRPPRIGGGNRRVPARRRSTSRRFNEAPANWRGKQRHGHAGHAALRPASMRPPRIGGGNINVSPVMKCVYYASMRPPRIGGGNSTPRRGRVKHHRASMRPPRIGGGNSDHAVRTTAEALRFNEAPANWRGKRRRPAAVAAGLRVASMRPPRIGGGNTCRARAAPPRCCRFNEAPANWRGKRPPA